MKKHQEYIYDSDDGIVKLDGPPEKGMFVNATPAKPGKFDRPKPRKKVKGADNDDTDKA